MTELAGIQKGRDMYSQNWVSFAYGTQSEPERSVRRQRHRDEAWNWWSDSQRARRSDAGGFLPHARPRSLKDEEFRT
jgi:hypothetical protein